MGSIAGEGRHKGQHQGVQPRLPAGEQAVWPQFLSSSGRKAADLGARAPLGLPQIVGDLHRQPHVGARPEGLGEPKRHVGAHAGSAVQERGESLAGYAQTPSALVTVMLFGRYSPKDFARMGGGCTYGTSFSSESNGNRGNREPRHSSLRIERRAANSAHRHGIQPSQTPAQRVQDAVRDVASVVFQ